MSAPSFGEAVVGWPQPPVPTDVSITGKYASVEPLSLERHSEELFDAFTRDKEGRIWDYLPYGPFDEIAAFRDFLSAQESSKDPMFFAIRKSGVACGMASYLRINPEDGSIEVGHINFSPSLQGTAAATEAMYLMMRWAFEGGYRRYEWKCDSLNKKSRRAAQRLGLSYEGVFRQAKIVKGRNRDTAWFAAIDKEWEQLKACFESYLSPENFDDAGIQKVSLSSLTRPLLVNRDPVLE